MDKSEIQKVYDVESQNYSRHRPWMRSYVFQRITEYIASLLTNFKEGHVILNVGCGPGSMEKFVCPSFREFHYVACDISPQMARLTKRHTPQIDVIVADGEALPFRSDSLDVIISSRTIKFLNHTRFFSQVNKALKNKGSFGIILDCGDALWVRLLEGIGKRVDVGIRERTIRTSDLTSKLSKFSFEIIKSAPITWLPLSLFSHIPDSLYSFLAFFDRPMTRGRITVIVGLKKLNNANKSIFPMN